MGITPPTPPPFKPELPHILLSRFRTAIAKIFTPEAAERDAPNEPDQIFDFAEEVRLVLTVQEGVDGKLILVVYAQAMGDREPLSASDQTFVIWLFKRLTLLHTIALLVYHDGHRIIAAYQAPPGAGEPMPQPPEPAAVAIEPSESEPEQVSFEIEIPPGLRSHRPDEIKATRIK